MLPELHYKESTFRFCSSYIKLRSEIFIRGDRRQVNFLSDFIVHATSQEMKSKWANLTESRLVERGAIFLYFFDYFAICGNALLCCLDSLYLPTLISHGGHLSCVIFSSSSAVKPISPYQYL